MKIVLVFAAVCFVKKAMRKIKFNASEKVFFETQINVKYAYLI